MESLGGRAHDPEKAVRIAHGVILGACAAVLGFSALLQAGDSRVELFGWPCPMKCFVHSVFGVRCAFCGMTRSFVLLAHGRLAEAVRQHPLGPAMFGYVVLQALYRAAALLGAGGRAMSRIGLLGWIAGAAVLAAILVHWLAYLGGLWI